MGEKRNTLSESIRRIAERTGASQEFVLRVRQLFERKGIPLDTDAEPYARALEDAFQRQATMRRTIEGAKASLSKLQSGVASLGDAVNAQSERLQLLREGLRRYQMIVEAHRASTSRRTEGGARLVRGDRDYPMVPGPDVDQ